MAVLLCPEGDLGCGGAILKAIHTSRVCQLRFDRPGIEYVSLVHDSPRRYPDVVEDISNGLKGLQASVLCVGTTT